MLHIREYVTFTIPDPVSCSKTHLKTRTIPSCMYQKKSSIYQGTGYWTRLKLRRIGGQFEGKPLQVELFLTAALQIMLCNYGLGASAPRAALSSASSVYLQYFFTSSLSYWTGVGCILLFKSKSITGVLSNQVLLLLFLFPKIFLIFDESREIQKKKFRSDCKPNHTFHNLPYKLCIFMDTTCIFRNGG